MRIFSECHSKLHSKVLNNRVLSWFLCLIVLPSIFLKKILEEYKCGDGRPTGMLLEIFWLPEVKVVIDG